MDLSTYFLAALLILPAAGLLALSVYAARRRAPGLVFVFLAALGLSAWSVLAWSFQVEPRLLVVKQVELTSARWPGRDLRIGILGDIHAGGFHMSAERLALIVRRMNEQKPDVIVLLGDFAGAKTRDGMKTPEGRAQTMAAFPELAKLKARYGVYAILGNHDWWFWGPHILEGLASADIEALENRAVRIKRGDDSFWLAGVADVTSTQARPSWPDALRDVPAGAPVLAISHRPDVFANVPDRVLLTMVGHSHCGQFRLPIIGPIAFASEGSRHWPCGLYGRDRTFLYVTGGVGFSVVPVRFLQPPEIDILTVTNGRDRKSALQPR